MQKKVGVKEWVSMFREIGLDDDAMKKWHHLFEARNPENHQSFLEWLGVSAPEIETIRKQSK